uniref:Uncharacterized protein n=1 Tax=Romanomermis culicivorax TaxID=13658 RepID=A0A915IQN8_ROMCU
MCATVVYAVFVDMNHFWRSNWIMDAFQNIDTPSYMWLNLFAQYETDTAKSTKAASKSSTIDYMVDDFYNGFSQRYNRELILPKWDNADYVEKWHSHRIGGQIGKVIDGELDIRDPMYATSKMFNIDLP